MSGRDEHEFGLAKSILYSIVIILFLFGLAEISVRMWGRYLRDDVETFDAASGTFVLVPGEHEANGGRILVNSDGFVGAELVAPGDDLWRIVALGDSCTFGGGNDTETYPAMLGGLLRAHEIPGRRYEVVNAGISGLNSDLAHRRLRSVVPPLEPDVVTVYLGWNDLMKVDPLSQSNEVPWISGAARILDQLWLARGLRKLFFYHLRPYLRAPATGPESRSGRFQDFRPSVFEQNLRGILATVEGLGARPAVATLPTVLRLEMSLPELRQAGIMFPYFPSAHAVGDFLDLIDAYNVTIRRIGESEGVAVIDLAGRFRELDDPRPYFWDTMHPSEKGMALVAETFFEALQREGLLGRGAPAAQPSADAGRGVATRQFAVTASR